MKILITGPAGSGKTKRLQELDIEGYYTIDEVSGMVELSKVLTRNKMYTHLAIATSVPLEHIPKNITDKFDIVEFPPTPIPTEKVGASSSVKAREAKEAMPDLTFVVKEESAKDFFIEFGRNVDARSTRDYGIHSLLKDTIYFKKGVFGGANPPPKVVFELHDVSMGSRTELVNVYTYSVSDYDNTSYTFELMDFDIQLRATEVRQ
jgi:hypothetical protein